MSDFFEIFNPGLRHTREQLDTEKLLVVKDDQGGTGPQPLDLDSGKVVLRMPAITPEPGEATGEPPSAATTPGDDSGLAVQPVVDPVVTGRLVAKLGEDQDGPVGGGQIASEAG